MADENTIDVPELSEAEVAAMLNAQGLAELAKDEVYVAYITGTLNMSLAEAGPVFYEALRQSLSGIADPTKMAAARDLMAREVSTWVTRMAETEIKKIGEIVAQGIEAGLHPFEIAKNLDMVTGLDSVRAKSYLKYLGYLDELDITDEEWESRADAMFQSLLKDRKEVIAQTEARYATAAGNDAIARATGKRWKAWITARDNRVSQMCQDCEVQGWIPIDEPFTTSNDLPPNHPRCRCTLAYREADPDELARQRAQARANETAAAMATAEGE